MNKDKYIFAQLASFLNRSKFNRIVAKYHGDRYVKHFTCWNQLLALMFGQLCNRESLRDLICALDAHHDKCYHLGIGRNVSKTNLAYANQVRDCRIFEEFAYYVVEEARNKRAAVIFANHYLIAQGQGLLVIPEAHVSIFKKLLVAYYEGEDPGIITTFLKENCWKTF